MKIFLFSLVIIVFLGGFAAAVPCPEGDLNGDCMVGWEDIKLFAEQWLNPGECEGDVCADFDDSNGINFADFAFMANHWLEGTTALVINEFMASNNSASGIADPCGDYDDWFEIYNFSDVNIDLAGMYLSDKPDKPTKWQVPSGYPSQTTIPAGGFVVFWADEEPAEGPLHANFKLSADGEDILLSNANGTLINSISFGPQTANISYQRYPDASDYWQFASTPTPGAHNNPAYLGEVNEVEFSHERGFYNASFNLTMACATSDVNIYYTTNGSNPIVGEVNTPRSIRYTSQVPISSTKCVRAAATKTGCMPSPITTHSYIFDANARIRSVPVISLVGDANQTFYEPNGIMAIVGGVYSTNYNGYYGWRSTGPGSYNNPIQRGKAYERPVSMEILNNDANKNTQIDCGIRVRGNVRDRYRRGDDWMAAHDPYCSGYNNYRFSFNMYFRNEYGENRFDYPLFPFIDIEHYASFAIRGGFNDIVNRFLGDEWARRVHIDMGAADVAGTFVHFYINGVFKCYMNPCGRQEEEFYQDWYNSDYDWDVIAQGEARDGDNIAFNTLQAYANSHDLGDTNNYDYVASQLDLPEFADYLILQVFAGNWDWPYGYSSEHNWAAARERSPYGKWRFAVWDAECIARSSEMGSDWSKDNFDKNFPSFWGNIPRGLNYLPGFIPEVYRALKTNPNFRQLWADRMHKLFRNGGALTKANLTAIHDQCYTEMGGIPSWWSSYDYSLRNDFIQNREAKFFTKCQAQGLIDNNFGYPIFNVNGSYKHGGYISSTDTITITQSTASGTTYYTTDGNDPRLPIQPFVTENAAKKVKVPTSDIGTTWRGGSEPYNDSSWTSGTRGAGYDTADDYDPYIGIDVQSAMYNFNTTCYIRIPFTIDACDIGHITSLTLRMRYDDGFVAYINGTEVKRMYLQGTTPAWNSYASTSREATPALESFDISTYISALHAGTNILAVHGLNQTKTDSDFLVCTELVGSVTNGSGGVSPDAIQYTSGFTLNKSTDLKSRIYNSSTGQWSVLNEAVYAVGPVADNLRITELMYHPQDTGDPNDPNTEYIELKNKGGSSINLNLVKFDKGIDFTFGPTTLAAGQHILVVKNLSAFEAKYGTGYNIAGQYTGSLANEGERIRLKDANGTTILYFSYGDGWRAITDGDGYSLTIINPANPDVNSWSEKDSWRASAYVNGSPGWDDSGIIPNPGAIVINEVLAHSHADASDWIELYNTTAGPINIGGWYLSDSNANLLKYRFAAGKTIPAHGYVVVYEDVNFGSPASDPGRLIPFALSENGEMVCLTSALDVNGSLTGYREKEDFGASETGVSLGRYYKASTNNYNFVAMDHNTPGQANAYPKVGPIVITEIMYHPDWPANGSYVDNEYEYIELRNTSASSVTLYDPNEGEPWKFTDGIDYTFGSPPNAVTITAGGRIIVAKNPTAFRWRYPSVPIGIIYGPYDGWLDNAGEKVEISKPGDEDAGIRYYIRVDRVDYSDGSHPQDCPGGVDLWPIQADGQGKSLTRTSTTRYGNDPNNWTAATPTPGS